MRPSYKRYSHDEQNVWWSLDCCRNNHWRRSISCPRFHFRGGFLPTTLLYIVSWLIAVASGYCFLEVLTWLHARKNVNMVSMAEHTLGHKGKIIMWLVYLLLFYSLLVAYFCDGGNILMRVLGCRDWDAPWIRHAMPIVFFALFSPLLMAKTSIVDWCNRFFVLGLGIAFAMFCFLASL